jgi:hypothetical protein
MGWDLVLLDAVAVAGAVLGWRAVRHFTRVWRDPGHDESGLWLLRGIRGFILAVACGIVALGVALGSRQVVLVGVVIAAEEIYETAMALAVVEYGRRHDGSAR